MNARFLTPWMGMAIALFSKCWVFLHSRITANCRSHLPSPVPSAPGPLCPETPSSRHRFQALLENLGPQKAGCLFPVLGPRRMGACACSEPDGLQAPAAPGPGGRPRTRPDGAPGRIIGLQSGEWIKLRASDSSTSRQKIPNSPLPVTGSSSLEGRALVGPFGNEATSLTIPFRPRTTDRLRIRTLEGEGFHTNLRARDTRKRRLCAFEVASRTTAPRQGGELLRRRGESTSRTRGVSARTRGVWRLRRVFVAEEIR